MCLAKSENYWARYIPGQVYTFSGMFDLGKGICNVLLAEPRNAGKNWGENKGKAVGSSGRGPAPVASGVWLAAFNLRKLP